MITTEEKLCLLPGNLYKKLIIKTGLNQDQLDFAVEKSERLKHLFDKDFVYRGSLGESTISKLVDRLQEVDTFNYDFKFGNGITIDVKTKNNKNGGEPTESDFCDLYNVNQITDFYVFCRVSTLKNICWIMGYISKKNFIDNATFVKKGDYRPGGVGKPVSADLWCLRAKYLTPWKNWRKDFLKEKEEKPNKERWTLKCYLAGWAKDLEYRKYAIEKYGNKFELVDPMVISWSDVNREVNKNIQDIWLVKRDKRLIDGCDVLIAKCDFLPYGELSVGTYMEIIYAYDHGIPVFLISSEDWILNNAWLKFHSKKGFKTIDECFEYLGGDI